MSTIRNYWPAARRSGDSSWGGIGHGGHQLGSDPVNSPSSQYWFTEDWDTVPLKAWAEERASEEPYDWGLGYGATCTLGPGYTFKQVKVPEK